MKRRVALALGLLLAAPVFASLVEEEIRISRDLQARMQSALDHVLGEGKATVLLNVQLQFSEESKKKTDNPARLETAAPAGLVETTKWVYPGGVEKDAPDVLPGFPAKAQKEQGAAPTVISVTPTAPAADPMVALNAGVRIRKVFVKVLLDKRLPASTDETVKAIVGSFVTLVPARGDAFLIARIRMPTLFEQAMRDPALLSPLLQRAATLAVVLIASIGFFVLGLAALATARRSTDRLASAVRALGGPGAGSAQTLPAGWQGLQIENAPPAPARAPSAERLVPAMPDIVFDVPAEKVAYLLEFLANEKLERVALVAQHLTPSTKSALLAMLSPAQAGDVVVAMSQMSIATPEELQKIKDEVERHVRGSSGGVLAVVDMLNAASPTMRRQLMESMAKKNPELGAAVRERIFLFEDLNRLGQADLSRVISQVQLADLAMALNKQPHDMRERLRAVLPELSWKVLQEETEHRGASASDQKIGEAQDRVVQTVYRLAREGAIAPEFLRISGIKSS